VSAWTCASRRLSTTSARWPGAVPCTTVPRGDGISYLGRHAAKHLNFCLFLDRCADALGFESEGTLADLKPHVLRAANAYNLAPRLFEPRDRRTRL
jgi:hypothetical protein